MGRLEKLPPYLFSAIDAAKRRARDRGVEVVDLGIGDPDRPTPQALVEVMAEAVTRGPNHRYPSQYGDTNLKQAIGLWLKKRHGVEVDPGTQILVLIGSKEGLGHLPLTCVEEGDNTLVPDLGYPVYGQATLLAGGTPRAFALPAERGFVPDPAAIDQLCDERSRMVFLNYPNNPTGAVVDEGFWREMLEVTRRRNLILVNDAAYMEVVNGPLRPVSLLRVANPAEDRVIELHSLSKMFNMTGWRIAFAAGHPGVIGALGRVKESMDSGVFTAVQETAAFALGAAFEDLLARVMAAYPSRRATIEEALKSAGFEIFPSPATFYVWARVPHGGDSIAFCSRVLEELGVVVTPGPGFGTGGEGWFRISLTASDEAIAEGARRFREWS
nr:aminotransferase class I/II-fold pyridoxal phosphate-dependent enzyme [Candidatus Krumholzibacteria bacterium]